MTDEIGKPATVDPANLSVAEVLKRYPAGRLVALVGTIFAAGFGGGYFIREKISAEELRHSVSEIGAMQKQTQLLQQALNAGNCIRSETVERHNEARRLVAKIEIDRRSLRVVRTAVLSGESLQGVGMEHDYSKSLDLGKFLDDPRVAVLISDLTIATLRMNEALATAWGAENSIELAKQAKSGQDMSSEQSAIDLVTRRIADYESSLTSTSEYMKAKYLLPL